MYVREVETALAEAAKNRYWRQTDAELVLSLWRDSGQTLAAFGRQWGISVARLRRWHRRLDGHDLPTFHPVAIVASEVPAVRSSPSVGGVEIVFDEGPRVIARPGFDEATLLRVLQALGAP